MAQLNEEHSLGTAGPHHYVQTEACVWDLIGELNVMTCWWKMSSAHVLSAPLQYLGQSA